MGGGLFLNVGSFLLIRGNKVAGYFPIRLSNLIVMRKSKAPGMCLKMGRMVGWSFLLFWRVY